MNGFKKICVVMGLLSAAVAPGCAPINYGGALSSHAPLSAASRAGGEVEWSGDPLAPSAFVARDPSPYFSWQGPAAAGATFEIQACADRSCNTLFTIDPAEPAFPVYNDWLADYEENFGFSSDGNFSRTRIQLSLCKYAELGFPAATYFRIRTVMSDGRIGPWIKATRNDAMSTPDAPMCEG